MARGNAALPKRMRDADARCGRAVVIPIPASLVGSAYLFPKRMRGADAVRPKRTNGAVDERLPKRISGADEGARPNLNADCDHSNSRASCFYARHNLQSLKHQEIMTVNNTFVHQRFQDN